MKNITKGFFCGKMRRKFDFESKRIFSIVKSGNYLKINHKFDTLRFWNYVKSKM